ncbi:type II secretion system protein [Pseudomonas triclosanedens]|nr:type II secretion system protein [Pseudomonas triclosanedens]
MRISATCPDDERQGGFTLLEMIVVLALVALLGAVVMPSLLKMQQAWQRRLDIQNVMAQIRSLGYRVRLAGQPAAFGPAGIMPSDLLSMPAGWEVGAASPLIYLANGACLGGELILRHDEAIEHITLPAPLCQPATP